METGLSARIIGTLGTINQDDILKGYDTEIESIIEQHMIAPETAIQRTYEFVS